MLEMSISMLSHLQKRGNVAGDIATVWCLRLLVDNLES
jgi:hypothetical protein